MSDEIPPGLHDARDTAHYILATLAGEQDPTATGIDQDLHARNRTLWNRWATSALEDAALQALIADGTIMAADVTDRSLDPIRRAAQARGLTELPNPDDQIAWRHTFWPENSANFGGFYFPQEVDFRGSTFKSDVDFNSATFRDFAEFSRAKFKGGADFDSATFRYPAGFLNTKFRHADFSRATFRDFAVFNNATFKRFSVFDSSTFRSLAVFLSAKFKGGADFDSATFIASANFTNTRFRGPSTFRGTIFLSDVPIFFGASLHEGTVFHHVIWPEVPRRDKQAARRQADAYERLKLEMDRLNRHEAELDFFAKELAALRHCPPRRRAWANAVYGAVSLYGRNVTRPLMVGAGIWYAGALAYKLLAGWPAGKAAGFSAASLAGVLGARREVFPGVLAQADWPIALLSTGQSIPGAILIFLIGLALRNWFRLR